MQTLRRTAHLGMDAATKAARKGSLGGSDARIIMSGTQEEVESLWREKRGEDPDVDLSEMLLIHMGNVTENLNLDWFEYQTGYVVTDDQEKVFHPTWEHAHATLDGKVRDALNGPVLGILEAKFMFPFHWSIEAAVEKYYPQVQHNAMVCGLPYGWLSVITGAGQWKAAKIEADVFYQHRLLRAEMDFWDCVVSGRTPTTQLVEQPERVLATVVKDMTGNNEWAMLAGELRETLKPSKRHDSLKRLLKKNFSEDMAKISGYGVSIRRGKDGRALWDIDEPDNTNDPEQKVA